MRHRFTLALYSDIELEAELSDYLLSLPKSRRSEVIRRICMDGYIKYKKEHNLSSSSPVKRTPKKPAGVPIKTAPIGETPKEQELSENHNKCLVRDSGVNQEPTETLHTGESIAENHSPTDNENNDIIDDDIDSLSDINKLFQGL